MSHLSIPSKLSNYLPNPNLPWQVSEELFKNLKFRPEDQGKHYKECRVPPESREGQLVSAYLNRDMPPNREIAEILCLHNPVTTASFETRIRKIQIEATNPANMPTWREEQPHPQREKTIAVWEKQSQEFGPIDFTKTAGRNDPHEKVKIFLLCHGSSIEKCRAIGEEGFKRFGKHKFEKGGGDTNSTDIGVGGDGIYYTSSPTYATEIYSKPVDGTEHLLLAWVCMRPPFPIISHEKVIPPKEPEDFEKLKGRGGYEKYNAHYMQVVPVRDPVSGKLHHYPAAPGEKPLYDEFVVFNEDQAVPRFWVKLKRATIPRGPSMLSYEERAARASTLSYQPSREIQELVSETLESIATGLKQFSHINGDQKIDKSVIIVGKKGAGKSVFTSLLAGAVLRAEYDPDYGEKKIKVVESPVNGCVVSDRAKSETSTPIRWTNPSNNISYWDCAGFEGTAGVPLEIANAACIKKIFQVSKQVALVVMINDQSIIERAPSLISIIKDLDQLLLGQIDRIKKSISLVVSHASPERNETDVQKHIMATVCDLEITGSQQKLLETLATQPIVIFKEPQFTSSDRKPYIINTNLLQIEFANNLHQKRVEFAENITADITVSDNSKTILYESYNTLVTDISENVGWFLGSFNNCMTTFISTYSDKDQHLTQLKNVLIQLEGVLAHTDSTQNIAVMIDTCIQIAAAGGGHIQSANLTRALTQVESMHALEGLIAKKSHIPLEIVTAIRAQIFTAQSNIEAAINTMTAIDAADKEAKEKQRAEKEARTAEQEKEREQSAREQLNQSILATQASIAKIEEYARIGEAAQPRGKKKKSSCIIS